MWNSPIKNEDPKLERERGNTLGIWRHDWRHWLPSAPFVFKCAKCANTAICHNIKTTEGVNNCSAKICSENPDPVLVVMGWGWCVTQTIQKYLQIKHPSHDNGAPGRTTCAATPQTFSGLQSASKCPTYSWAIGSAWRMIVKGVLLCKGVRNDPHEQGGQGFFTRTWFYTSPVIAFNVVADWCNYTNYWIYRNATSLIVCD